MHICLVHKAISTLIARAREQFEILQPNKRFFQQSRRHIAIFPLPSNRNAHPQRLRDSRVHIFPVRVNLSADDTHTHIPTHFQLHLLDSCRPRLKSLLQVLEKLELGCDDWL